MKFQIKRTKYTTTKSDLKSLNSHQIRIVEKTLTLECYSKSYSLSTIYIRIFLL